MTQHRGFELFNDVEETNLRNQNRAVVLSNISEDHSKNRLITPKGMALILGYFNEVPMEDRLDVKDRYANEMRLKGWVISK